VHDTALNIAFQWFNIVSAYSRGKLTFAEDKLVAISGAARLFAEPGRTYLAGMWEQDLVRQLPWFVEGWDQNFESNHGATCNIFHAPSWSWASIDCAVHLPVAITPSACELWAKIEEISMTPSEDPFVEFRGGHLRLRCKHMACGSIVPIDLDSDLKFEMNVFGTIINGGHVFPDPRHQSLDDHIFYLPLVLATMEGWRGAPYPWIVGIVLKKFDSNSFSRVGSFWLLTMTRSRNSNSSEIRVAKKTIKSWKRQGWMKMETLSTLSKSSDKTDDRFGQPRRARTHAQLRPDKHGDQREHCTFTRLTRSQ
jgi:hypothetical protein